MCTLGHFWLFLLSSWPPSTTPDNAFTSQKQSTHFYPFWFSNAQFYLNENEAYVEGRLVPVFVKLPFFMVIYDWQSGNLTKISQSKATWEMLVIKVYGCFVFINTWHVSPPPPHTGKKSAEFHSMWGTINQQWQHTYFKQIYVTTYNVYQMCLQKEKVKSF